MSKSRLLGTVLTCFLILFASSSNGALISGSCGGAIDSTLVCDGDTGMEWLKLTETEGLSYNEAVANFTNFRVATLTETIVLFGNAGFVGISNSSSNQAVFDTANAFIDLFGCTSRCNGDRISIGLADTDPVTTIVSNPFVQFNTVNSVPSASVQWDSNGTTTIGKDTASITRGVWMVSTVPIPAAVWLFGSGFLALVGIAGRKKAA